MHIAILGGYGNAGRLIARFLAQRSSVQITLLGRNEQKARETAAALARETGRDVQGCRADASDADSLTSVLQQADILVVASSSIDHVQAVAEAALATQTDYLDIQLSAPQKIDVLRRLEPAIKEQGRCFITDGGFHPGVPAAMVRYAGCRIPGLDKAVVGGVFNIDWKALSFSEETMSEFVTELKAFDPSMYEDGRWVRRMSTVRPFDFGPPFGKKSCVPMLFEEMRSLPEQMPALKETGFFIAGFGPVVDYLVMPLSFAMLAVAPGQADRVGRFFLWGLKHFSRGEPDATLVLEAEGATEQGRRSLRVQVLHDDAYVLTAVPVVACLLQYLDGPAKPGFWTQAHFVDPVRFFDDIQAMGITVDVREGTVGG